jgi:SAM-dependent methyltransferase
MDVSVEDPTPPPVTDEPAPDAAAQPPPAVIWHDLECGGYDADLPLWRELAAEAANGSGSAGSGAILEVGAGTGRVALDLLARRRDVTALDVDADLLATLRTRAAEATGVGRDTRQPPGRLATVCADARALAGPGGRALGSQSFALCIAAMQTVQLFGGPGGRAGFLRGVRRHLHPGGVLACAIVEQLDSFDVDAGDRGPSPERRQLGGREYVSRALRVRVGPHEITIEREREVRDNSSAAAGAVERERERTTLDRVDAASLAVEAEAAGMRALGIRAVPPTRDHVGSTVVVLGA